MGIFLRKTSSRKTAEFVRVFRVGTLLHAAAETAEYRILSQ